MNKSAIKNIILNVLDGLLEAFKIPGITEEQDKKLDAIIEDLAEWALGVASKE